MYDFTDPRGRFGKSAVRRGWLLVLLVLAVFIALTKLLPDGARGTIPARHVTDVAKPGH